MPICAITVAEGCVPEPTRTRATSESKKNVFLALQNRQSVTVVAPALALVDVVTVEEVCRGCCDQWWRRELSRGQRPRPAA